MTCIVLLSLFILFGAAAAAGMRRPAKVARPIRIASTSHRQLR